MKPEPTDHLQCPMTDYIESGNEKDGLTLPDPYMVNSTNDNHSIGRLGRPHLKRNHSIHGEISQPKNGRSSNQECDGKSNKQQQNYNELKNIDFTDTDNQNE